MVDRIWIEDLQKHGKLDLIPQAIINRSVASLERHCAFHFDDEGHDGLDHYRAAYLRVAGRIAALIHHDSEPEHDVTIYLSRKLDRREADRSLAKLLKAFSLPEDVVTWRETQDLRR